ncbi:MAG: hypothetical protein MUE96_09825 [Bacteroidia bacterium]|jgi:hypothetical protein|nr:hypothetical protein [Bacteroidia bacterium]
MENNRLYKTSKIHLQSIVRSAKAFNNNSANAEDVNFVVIPFPFKSLAENESLIFDEFIKYLTNLKPNINIDSLYDGTYLEAFLIQSNNTQYLLTTIAMVPKRCIGKINNLSYPLEVYSFGDMAEITEQNFEMLKRYGLRMPYFNN